MRPVSFNGRKDIVTCKFLQETKSLETGVSSSGNQAVVEATGELLSGY